MASARRLQESLENLAEVDPVFTTWKETVHSAPEDAELVSTGVEALAERVESGDTGTDGLGYVVSFWSGSIDGQAVSMRIVCGAENISTGPNSLVLQLPKQRAWLKSDSGRKKCRQVMEVVAKAWKPEWGTAITMEMNRKLEDMNLRHREPLCGWMLYLDSVRSDVPEIPEAYEIVRDFAGGTLLITSPAPLWASNEEDVAKVKELHTKLRDAGVMIPTGRA